MLAPGTPAPGFSLPDQDGKNHALADLRGRFVLLYFYPKDDTPGCTKEACGLRDAMKDYDAADCVVLGVSADTAESHKAFADKYGLSFPLLADTRMAAVNAYGAYGENTWSDGSKHMGIRRVSYLIAPDGNIAKAYPDVRPEEHAAEVLADVRARR